MSQFRLKSKVLAIIGFYVVIAVSAIYFSSFQRVTRWKFVSTSGGIAGTTTSSNHDELEITATTLRYFLQGKLVAERTYTTTTGKSIRTGKNETMLLIGPTALFPTEMQRTATTLTLIDNVYDGYQTLYEAQK